VCNQQQKKTISADHVLLALEKLGFGDFVKEAEEVLVPTASVEEPCHFA
jgi:hypothetical protein